MEKEKVILMQVYYCKRCEVFTDVNYISDKFGGRKKSYCYKCSNEMLDPVKVIINGQTNKRRVKCLGI